MNHFPLKYLVIKNIITTRPIVERNRYKFIWSGWTVRKSRTDHPKRIPRNEIMTHFKYRIFYSFYSHEDKILKLIINIYTMHYKIDQFNNYINFLNVKCPVLVPIIITIQSTLIVYLESEELLIWGINNLLINSGDIRYNITQFHD